MKKIFGILTVVAILLMSSISTYALSITIRFGAPTEKGCIGLGICEMSGSLLRDNPNSATADVSLTSTGKLKLVFMAQSMSATTLAKNFSNNSFTLETDYTTSPEMMQLLNLTSPYTVSKGIYKIVKSPSNNSFELVL